VSEKMGLRILEIPIYFDDRRIGQSKMDMREKVDAPCGCSRYGGGATGVGIAYPRPARSPKTIVFFLSG